MLPKILYEYFSAQNILFNYTVQRQTYLNFQFSLMFGSLKHLNFAKSLDQITLQQGTRTFKYCRGLHPLSTIFFIRPAKDFKEIMQLYFNFIKRTNTDNNNKTLGVDGY